MRVARLFNVLVLGGAALACEESARDDHGASSAGSGPHAAGTTSGGSGSSPANEGSVGGGPIDGAGGSTESGSGGGSEADSGGSGSAGGAGSSGSGSASDGGSGGMSAVGDAGSAPFAGTGGLVSALECHLDAQGHGRASDPCGCPCCWTKDCLNTDEKCCGGFCGSCCDL
jgi:hypothetical protein